jgi:serine/threonine protein kinase/DNA-binding winged helix-turn-helix (wHTH) protein/dipeptidyl aminopeptidase/acylaminoacyl peptidase
LRRNLEEFRPGLMSQKTKHLYAFGPFSLDTSECVLALEGRPVPLAPKAFEALVILVENAGHLIDKDDLMKRLWPDSFVEEGNVAKHVSLLRKVLSEAANGGDYIETVPKRGYRFVVDVREVADAEAYSQSLAFPRTNLIGKKISHYRVLEILGGGGMGLVYKAEDLKLSRRVALKVLPEELGNDAKAVERFEREARAASALDHSNICSIHEFGEHEGQPFIVMQLLEGRTLREHIGIESQPDKPLPTRELLDLAIQVTSGLEAAHQKGIIHRDIKPANIFITNRGEAKILDFGVATLVQGAGQPDASAEPESPNKTVPTEVSSSFLRGLTLTGANLGTASYMSPEQILGEKLDTRSDLFSFGLVLHEMATGQHPFAAETAEMVRTAILQRPIQPARELNPELPSKMEEVIAKALEKHRNSRYQHATEMRADLESMRRDLEARRPARTRVLAAGVAAVLLIASGALWFAKRQPTSSPAPQLRLRQLTSNSSENAVIIGTISPDGRYLAYSDLAGMHIQNIESGESRSISLPDGFDGDKAEWAVGFWSPDGTRFFANAHQPGQNLPDWASHGTSTWAVSVLGGAPRKLRDEAMSSTVSPDGSAISFGANKGAFGDREIWLMDQNGEHARKLFGPDQESSIVQINWSPNTKRVIYQKTDDSGNTILSRDLEGGFPTTILSPSEAEGLKDYIWLPDGRLIYTSGEATTISAGDTTCNFWQLRIDASTGKRIEKPSRLTNWPGFCNSALSVTADGKRLAFLKQALHFSTYVSDLDMTRTRITNTTHFTLTESFDIPEDWTADNKAIILKSNRTGHYGIYMQALNEETAKPLTSGQNNVWNAHVSPDGKWVLYQRDTKPPEEILRVPINGGLPEVITTTRSEGFFSCAKAPSDLCVIVEPTEDRKEIVITSLDPAKGRGSEITRFPLDTRTNSWDVNHASLSPDGARVAAIRSPDGPLEIVSLRGHAPQEIQLKDWNNLQTVVWDANGTGLFVSDGIQGGAALLAVDLRGHAHVLWRNHGYNLTNVRPSPDGRHLAILGSSVDSSMWMMENF